MAVAFRIDPAARKFHNQMGNQTGLILDSRHVKQGHRKTSNDSERMINMAVKQKASPQSVGKIANGQPVEPQSKNAESIQRLDQAGVDQLTPLQRQRLDAAVMMLVNYLVSVSSSG